MTFKFKNSIGVFQTSCAKIFSKMIFTRHFSIDDLLASYNLPNSFKKGFRGEIGTIFPYHSSRCFQV
jgi:hypothetical protein